METFADLKVIDIVKLQQNDKHEQAYLLRACEDFGFFYLHIPAHTDGEEIQGLWTQVDSIFGIMKKFFNLPIGEKMKYDARQFGVSEITG